MAVNALMDGLEDPAVMAIIAVASLLVPLRLAFTVNATTPAFDPAVNVVERPVEGFSDPRLLFNDQVYVMPEDGQDPGEQAGVAVNPCVPPA